MSQVVARVVVELLQFSLRCKKERQDYTQSHEQAGLEPAKVQRITSLAWRGGLGSQITFEVYQESGVSSPIGSTKRDHDAGEAAKEVECVVGGMRERVLGM